MFDPDIHPGIPIADELLAEIGIDPQAVREVVEDDRAMRCPDHDTVPRAAARPFGPVPAHRPAEWSGEEL